MCKYKVGDVLVFVGESKNFKKGKRYRIFKIDKIDYYIDEVDSNYGKTCLYFEKTHFGCYTEYADDNFKHIDKHREDKLNEILK